MRNDHFKLLPSRNRVVWYRTSHLLVGVWYKTIQLASGTGTVGMRHNGKRRVRTTHQVLRAQGGRAHLHARVVVHVVARRLASRRLPIHP